jgi:hypothetical protein
MAELNIDFLERWGEFCGGSGTDRLGYYNTIGFSNMDESNPKAPFDWFEIKLYFNKKVDIIGHAGKKCWRGVVIAEKALRQAYRQRDPKFHQYIDLSKRSKP